MFFTLMSPPADFLAVYLFGKYRTDTVIRVAATVSFAGAMLRFISFANDEFWPILLGAFMMASVSSIFLNSQIILVNRWFSDTERALAMSLICVAQPVGIIFSFMLSGYVYSQVTQEMDSD